MTITSSKPWRAQQLEDVLHARLADDRHHRLRLVRGQRAQTRALAARHDDGLHAVFTLPPEAVSTYWTRGGDREREADPEEPDRPVGAVGVTMMRAERRVEDPGRNLAEHAHVEVVPSPRRCGSRRPATTSRSTISERDERQATVEPEQDHGCVDHQPVGEWVGDLAERGLDMPAPSEPAVDLVGERRRRRRRCRPPSCALRRPRP